MLFAQANIASLGQSDKAAEGERRGLAGDRLVIQGKISNILESSWVSDDTTGPCHSRTERDCSTFSYSHNKLMLGRHGGLMVSALISGSSGPGSSPGRGHCVVFLGKTLYSHSASLHPGV